MNEKMNKPAESHGGENRLNTLIVVRTVRRQKHLPQMAGQPQPGQQFSQDVESFSMYLHSPFV